MRYPKPYYRTSRQTWCVQIGRDQYTLVKGPKEETKEEGYRRYHALMASRGRAAPVGNLTVAGACELFLDHAERSVKANTYQQYRIKLQQLVDTLGSVKLDELTAEQIADWAASRGWSDSTRRGAITAVKVCLAWCVRTGHATANPARDVKRPRMRRRERTVTAAERAAIRAEFADGFGDFLDALGWTGARPGEVMRLEAAHVDWDAAYAALPGKTTGATGELVEFPLIPPMFELCRRLAEAHPTGPLFRNAKGGPWTENAVRCRMRRLRRRLGIAGVTAYTYRHSFATDALERGVPLADVAALMNHKDVRTTMGYNHLGKRRDHLRRQAERAQGEQGSVIP